MIRIRCKRCGRCGYMGPRDLIGRKLRAGTIRSHTSPEDIAALMRCRGEGPSPGCGHLGAEITVHWPHELGIPNGVPVLQYIRADDRERKRLIRIARD